MQKNSLSEDRLKMPGILNQRRVISESFLFLTFFFLRQSRKKDRTLAVRIIGTTLV